MCLLLTQAHTHIHTTHTHIHVANQGLTSGAIQAVHACAHTRLACHASVRGGDILNRTEAYALLQQLDEAETAGACPHGRPVVAEFARDAVERWFGRDR